MINLQIPTKLIIFALRKPKTSSGCGAVGSVRVWGRVVASSSLVIPTWKETDNRKIKGFFYDYCMIRWAAFGDFSYDVAAAFHLNFVVGHKRILLFIKV